MVEFIRICFQLIIEVLGARKLKFGIWITTLSFSSAESLSDDIIG